MAGVELDSQQGWREESQRPQREEVMYRQAGAAGFYRESPWGAEDAGDTREFIQIVLGVQGWHKNSPIVLAGTSCLPQLWLPNIR